MGSLEKKMRDNKDKAILERKFGKTPKHRCPDCHRFTFWVSDKNVKSQCIWCKMEMEDRINAGITN